MSYSISETYYLSIDGVPMSTPAWRLTNSHVFWDGADTRGDNRIIPGAAGVRAKRVRTAQTQVSLIVAVFGSHDWEGNEYADANVGLWTNLEYLKDYVTDPTNTGDGTRAAVLHVPGGTRTGDIQVRKLRTLPLSPTDLELTIDIIIPAGALV